MPPHPGNQPPGLFLAELGFFVRHVLEPLVEPGRDVPKGHFSPNRSKRPDFKFSAGEILIFVVPAQGGRQVRARD